MEHSRSITQIIVILTNYTGILSSHHNLYLIQETILTCNTGFYGVIATSNSGTCIILLQSNLLIT